MSGMDFDFEALRHGITGIANDYQNNDISFMAAVIQCLRHSEGLWNFIRDSQSSAVISKQTGIRVEERRLAYIIHLIINEMWSNKFCTIWITQLKNIMTQYAAITDQAYAENAAMVGEFISSQNQNPVSFLNFILDVLHKTYNTTNKLAEGIASNDGEDIMTYLNRYSDINKSVIVDTFRILERTDFVCQACQLQTSSFEYKNYLQMPLPVSGLGPGGVVFLEQLLKQYVGRDQLDPIVRQRACPCTPNQTQPHDATKVFENQPACLIIAIARGGGAGQFQQNFVLSMLGIVDNFDMTAFFAAPSTAMQPVLNYNLYGAIVNNGDDQNGQHVAYVRPDIVQDPNRWLTFDNNVINIGDAPDIFHELQFVQATRILFYRPA